jgi:hypothetical protein
VPGCIALLWARQPGVVAAVDAARLRLRRWWTLAILQERLRQWRLLHLRVDADAAVVAGVVAADAAAPAACRPDNTLCG